MEWTETVTSPPSEMVSPPVTSMVGSSSPEMAASPAAFQVSARGDLANWHTGRPDAIRAVGGAMDLATGAKQTSVMMTLLTRDGRSKLVPECTMPLTGVECVSRIYTDHAVFLIEPDGVVVGDLFGISFTDLQDLVAVPLIDGTASTRQ